MKDNRSEKYQKLIINIDDIMHFVELVFIQGGCKVLLHSRLPQIEHLCCLARNLQQMVSHLSIVIFLFSSQIAQIPRDIYHHLE